MKNSQELFDTFREDVVDTELPYLWTDKEVVEYADAAYRMFVRLTTGIADFTSDVTRIDLVAGEDIVELDPSILRVMSATLVSTTANIEVLNAPDLPLLFQTNVDYGSLRTLTMKNEPGTPRWMIMGMEKNKAKIIKIPTVDDQIQMFVYRLPIERIVDGNHPLDEVSEDHHRYLLDWMKHLAYKKQDTETFDKTKSEKAENDFKAYCSLCKSEWERYKHKTRVVEYGGI